MEEANSDKQLFIVGGPVSLSNNDKDAENVDRMTRVCLIIPLTLKQLVERCKSRRHLGIRKQRKEYEKC